MLLLRKTAVPDEHPRVGSVWMDLSVSPMVLGVVTQTDHKKKKRKKGKSIGFQKKEQRGKPTSNQ